MRPEAAIDRSPRCGDDLLKFSSHRFGPSGVSGPAEELPRAAARGEHPGLRGPDHSGGGGDPSPYCEVDDEGMRADGVQPDWKGVEIRVKRADSASPDGLLIDHFELSAQRAPRVDEVTSPWIVAKSVCTVLSSVTDHPI